MCLCHMQLSISGPENNYAECQPHMNQTTFVFNATVIAITGKNNPEAHIQMLSSNNISCRNFSREGKKLKILWEMIPLLRFIFEMFPKRHDTRDYNTYICCNLNIYVYIYCRKKHMWNWNVLVFFLCHRWNCTLIESHFQITVTLKRLKSLLMKGLLRCVACHLLL